MSALLIQPTSLFDLIQTGKCIVFDVRHDLTDHQAGFRAWSSAHIPGAIFLDHERDLCAPKTGKNGRHPLPALADFEALMRSHGVAPWVHVVVYDTSHGAFAAHLWWMLRWMGHENVSLLDGGWAAWQSAGLPTASGAGQSGVAGALPSGVASQEVTNSLSANGISPAMPTVDAGQVLHNIDQPRFVVIDARAENRFRGETEPMDPVAGHIPGALNRPNTLNCQPDGRFLPADQLRTAFQTLLGGRAPTEVVHQCGSGITACHNLFAMELAGMSGSALYAGSWSEWCSDPARPVATGA